MGRPTSAELTAAQALAVRLRSLGLRDRPEGAGQASPGEAREVGETSETGVRKVVEWFGAMQAQDHGSVMWSLGRRLPGRTLGDVEAALERREAVKTWPMRGTIHLVPPRDAGWMVRILGERPLAQAPTRREFLGLSQRTADRAVEVLGDALAGGRRLTRGQCAEVWADAGIELPNPGTYHVIWYASQLGVTCLGPGQGSEQTVVLLDEWVPHPHDPDRDDALGIIAARYVRSHGPVTRQDFANWTGLRAADATRGIEAATDDIATVRVDGVPMLVHPAALDGPLPAMDRTMDPLSGFDEYLLGYKDRTLMVDPVHVGALVPGRNGVFQWTVVRGGRVVGTWRRSTLRNTTRVSVRPLVELADRERSATEAALTPYAAFIGRSVEVEWVGPDDGRPARSS